MLAGGELLALGGAAIPAVPQPVMHLVREGEVVERQRAVERVERGGVAAGGVAVAVVGTVRAAILLHPLLVPGTLDVCGAADRCGTLADPEFGGEDVGAPRIDVVVGLGRDEVEVAERRRRRASRHGVGGPGGGGQRGG